MTDARHNSVLLADDDPTILRLLSRVLESAGYLVDVAADGAEALATAQRTHPDFVITDWDMPRLNGLELCRCLRALDLPKYLYLLFLTGKSETAAVIEGLGAGADDFIAKPVVPAELLARVRAGARVLERERMLRVLAETDPLTGIPTRRVFHSRLEQEFARSQRYGTPLSCVMLDVDFFKRVNDAYGHPAGDAVLRGIASLLDKARRTSDLVCRFGGEEFCAMLPETDEAAACQWAERVRARIAEQPISIGESTVNVTVSLGAAERLDDTAACEKLIDHADQALLVAKQSGRDRVVSFTAIDDRVKIELPEEGSPLGGVLARDIMSSPVPCLRQIESVAQAAEFFVRFRINSAPVVDEQGILVGVLSERDVMAIMLSTDPWQHRVREVMKQQVVAYKESVVARTIYDFLCRVSLRRVIIVDEEGRPTGIIGRRNIVRRLHHWMQATGRQPFDSRGTFAGLERRRARRRMDDAAASLVSCAEALRDQMADRRNELVPLVIDGATRMQELIGDLLALTNLATGDQGETQPHLPTF